MFVMVEIQLMHLIYDHTVTIVRECTKMMQTIPHNEYLNEVMVKELVMRHVIMATFFLMMGVILTDH